VHLPGHLFLPQWGLHISAKEEESMWEPPGLLWPSLSYLRIEYMRMEEISIYCSTRCPKWRKWCWKQKGEQIEVKRPGLSYCTVFHQTCVNLSPWACHSPPRRQTHTIQVLYDCPGSGRPCPARLVQTIKGLGFTLASVYHPPPPKGWVQKSMHLSTNSWGSRQICGQVAHHNPSSGFPG
jgi:hypothetical protein